MDSRYSMLHRTKESGAVRACLIWVYTILWASTRQERNCYCRSEVTSSQCFLWRARLVRSEKQRMLAGELYHASDPELQRDQAASRAWVVRYNAALGASDADRHALLRERLAEVGEGSVIRPPFHCDYGYNIWLGAGVFLNFNCVILDVVAVTIGAGTQIGPAVQIYTADHPRDPALRKTGAELGRQIKIGRNVWIGGGAIILPGITIEDDAIIGAASVVTRNVAAGAVARGNPARGANDGKFTDEASRDGKTPIGL